MAPSITKLSYYYLSQPYQTVWPRSTSSRTEEIREPPIEFRITGRTCLAIISYVLKLCSNSEQHDHIVLIDTIRRLNELASRPMYQEVERVFLISFMPKVQKFFNVPNLQDKLFERITSTTSVSIPMRNEILADFIHFLLQVLYSDVDAESEYASRLTEPPYRKLLSSDNGLSLLKELTFLLTYLGDIPFQDTSDQLVEKVNNDILDDFAAVANGVGNFIYSRVFASSPIEDNGVVSILKNVDILNAKIVDHCNKSSMTFKSVTPTSTYFDSLFIIQSLIEDLNDVMDARVNRIVGDVKDQIKTLQQILMYTRSFLKDINAPQGTEIHEQLKYYLVRIRDLGYEAEYLIHSFVAGNVPVWYVELRLTDVVQKFELIATGYDELKMIYGVKVLRFHEDSTTQVPKSQAIESSMVDDIVVGFDKETIRILDALTGGAKNQQIISILGMPGLGKTTLANKIYNNRSVIDYFDVRAWCVVSQTYNKRKVLIDLLMSSPSKPDKVTLLNMDEELLAIKMQQTLSLLNMDDGSLAVKSHKTLTGRRYLIVLDDVWSSEVWDDLRRYFPDNKNGSRIMFTSQIRDIVPSNSIIQELPLLSKDQCWKLLEKKVFRLESCPPLLVDTGKQIAAKCSGLPLAIVVMAGILSNKEKDEFVWKAVDESLDLHMSNCVKILELSYKHLPDHLKLCFLYLGVFTGDAEVPVKKLLQLWIAEGFIEKQEEDKEIVAKSYLMELIDRSLVLIANNRSTGGVKACSVHDLLRDMCLRKAHEENFLKEAKDDRFSTYNKYHRLCVNSAALGYLRPFSLHCRSFFGHLSDPSSCFPQMKLLRVMELSRNIEMHTEYKVTGIDHLVYLRYLYVDQIPELTIGRHLNNLEFLHIDSRKHSINIPSFVLKLPKLKHVHVRLRAKFDNDCHSSQVNNLETLSFVCIYTYKDYEILRTSPHLRKLKCKCKPVLPDLQFLTKLESLKVEVDIWQITNNPTMINFPPTIKKLSLFGIFLPWERMSILGRLPNLEVLKLLMDAFDGEEWEMTSEGGFQELRFLKLDRLNLKRWIASSEDFPKLQHLVLHKCEGLQNFPTELGDIMTLEMIEVHHCSYEASIFAVQIEQEQLDNGNEEFKVIITNNEWSKEELVQKYHEES